jgi:hypothetical protein
MKKKTNQPTLEMVRCEIAFTEEEEVILFEVAWRENMLPDDFVRSVTRKAVGL